MKEGEAGRAQEFLKNVEVMILMKMIIMIIVIIITISSSIVCLFIQAR